MQILREVICAETQWCVLQIPSYPFFLLCPLALEKTTHHGSWCRTLGYALRARTTQPKGCFSLRQQPLPVGKRRQELDTHGPTFSLHGWPILVPSGKSWHWESTPLLGVPLQLMAKKKPRSYGPFRISHPPFTLAAALLLHLPHKT